MAARWAGCASSRALRLPWKEPSVQLGAEGGEINKKKNRREKEIHHPNPED